MAAQVQHSKRVSFKTFYLPQIQCSNSILFRFDKIIDDPKSLEHKVSILADWLRQYKGSCVIHAGAGLSTSAGIRDFRGKNGVWTELVVSKPKDNNSNDNATTKRIKLEHSDNIEIGYRSQKLIPFDEAKPTYSHMVLKKLCQLGFIRHIISQNVDGLFLKSGLQRKFVSELHGNFYLDECTSCKSRFIRSEASKTMRLQRSHIKCPRNKNGSPCRGYLRDTILDWESPIPHHELSKATRESKQSKLHICIGTTLQLSPSKDLVCKPSPNQSKISSKKLAIINLQPTKFDLNASLLIHYYADDVMKELAKQLKIEIDDYAESLDPTKDPQKKGSMWSKS